MKVKQLKQQIIEKISCCAFEESEFEADCMIADLLGVTNSVLRVMNESEVSDETVVKCEEFVQRRLNGEPLQYIFGKWEFYANSFYVGEGVLIPRPETELLVDIAIDFLNGKPDATCLDLCSGSGCIGISVAKAIKSAEVTMLEKSDKAFEYLKKNISLNAVSNCRAIIGDVFDGALQLDGFQYDLLLSNPPYIRSDLISDLQREVQAEPHMALDGGTDGLDFYRAIAEKWFCVVKPDGLVAVEIGEEQGRDVSTIFSKYFKDVTVIKDYSGNDRVVTAKNKISE